MNRIGTLVFGILGIGLILLIAFNSRGEVFGIESDQFARMLVFGTIALVIGASFLRRGVPIGATARSFGIWVLIVLVLVAGYQYRFELQDVASRVSAGLVPGTPISGKDGAGRTTVVLEKSGDGHFTARASVQGAAVRLLIDTGASTTVLTARDAARVGFNIDRLNFTVSVSTANGVTQAAPAIASQIAVGAISRERQQVLVAREGSLSQSLLGMTFINSLAGFQIKGDRMILTD